MSTPQGNIVSLEPQKDTFEFSWQEAVRWFTYEGLLPRNAPLYFDLVFLNSWIHPTARRELTIIYAPPAVFEANPSCTLTVASIKMISDSDVAQTATVDENGSYVLSGSRRTELSFTHDMDTCNPELVGGWEYEIELILRRIQVLYFDCGERLTCPGFKYNCEIMPLQCDTPLQDMVVDNGQTKYSCRDIYGQVYGNSCMAIQDQNKKKTVECKYTTPQEMPNKCVIRDLLIPHPKQFFLAQHKPHLSFDINSLTACFDGDWDACPFQQICFYILPEVFRYPDFHGCDLLRDYTNQYISAWVELIGRDIHENQYQFSQLFGDSLSRWLKKAQVSYTDPSSASITLPRFSQQIPENAMIYVHALIYQKTGSDKPVFLTTIPVPVLLWQPPPLPSNINNADYYFSGLQRVDMIPWASQLEVMPRLETQDPTYTYEYSAEIRKQSDFALVEQISFEAGKLTIKADQLIGKFGLQVAENNSDLILVLRRKGKDQQGNPRYEREVEVKVKPRMMPPSTSEVNASCQPSISEIGFESGAAITTNAESVYEVGIELLNDHSGQDILIEFTSAGCTGQLWELFVRNTDNFHSERAQFVPGQQFPSLCSQELLHCTDQTCESEFSDKIYSNCEEKTDNQGVSYTICEKEEAPRCVIKNANELHPKERNELAGCYDKERSQWADGRCGIPPFCLDSQFVLSTITLINYSEIIKLLLRDHTFTISDLDLSSFHHFSEATLWEGLGAQSTIADIESQFLRVARLTSRDILVALFPNLHDVCSHFYYFKNRPNIEPLILSDSEIQPPLNINLMRSEAQLTITHGEAMRLARSSKIHEVNVNFIFTGQDSPPDYAVLPIKLQFTQPQDYTFDIVLDPYPSHLYTSQKLRLVAKILERDRTEPFKEDRFQIMWHCPQNLENYCSTQSRPIIMTDSHAIYTSILEIPRNSAQQEMMSEIKITASKKGTWASLEKRAKLQYELMSDSQCRIEILTPDLTVSQNVVRIEWIYAHTLCSLQDIIFQIRKDGSDCAWCGLSESCGNGRGYSQIHSKSVSPGMHEILIEFSFLRGGVSQSVNRQLIVRKQKQNSLQPHFESLKRTISRNKELSLPLTHNPTEKEFTYKWIKCPEEFKTRCALQFTDSLEISTRDSFKETRNIFKVEVDTPQEMNETEIELIVTPQALSGLKFIREHSATAAHYEIMSSDLSDLQYRWVVEAVNGVTKQVKYLGFEAMTSEDNHLTLHLSNIAEGVHIMLEVTITREDQRVTFEDQFNTPYYERGYVEVIGNREIVAGVGALSLQFHDYDAHQYMVVCGGTIMARSFNPLMKEIEVLADTKCVAEVLFPNGRIESMPLEGVSISKAQVIDIELMRPDYLLLERDQLNKVELKRVNQRLRDQMEYFASKILCTQQNSQSALPQAISSLFRHVRALDVRGDFDNDAERSSHIKFFEEYFAQIVHDTIELDDPALVRPLLIVFMKLLEERRKLKNPELSRLFSDLKPLLKIAQGAMVQKFKDQGVALLVAHTPAMRSHFYEPFPQAHIHIQQETYKCRKAAEQRQQRQAATLVLIQKPSQAQSKDNNLVIITPTTQTYCVTDDGYLIELSDRGVTSISYSNLKDSRNLEQSEPSECRLWADGEWREIETTNAGDSTICVTTKEGEIALVQSAKPPPKKKGKDSTPLWLILMIVGICVGCAVLLIIIILVLKKRRKQKLMKHKIMATETETPRPKDSTSKMLDDQKRSEVPETSRELKKEQNNHSLEDIE